MKYCVVSQRPDAIPFSVAYFETYYEAQHYIIDMMSLFETASHLFPSRYFILRYDEGLNIFNDSVEFRY